VNFRSNSSVVRWVNTVFSQAFPQRDDLPRGGVRYSHSEARSADALTTGVHCCLWQQDADADCPAATRREFEALQIARLCRQLHDADPQHSIAVLVRSRSHLRELVPALRALDLRWNASKIDRLLSYPDIGDLFTLLRALVSLADSTAWLALLRTPFIGLTLPDIQQLASHTRQHQQSLWSTLRQYQELPALSADAGLRLQRCVPLLQEARARRQRLPLRQVLEALWIALGGPACLPSSALLPNVATFFALVEQHAPHDEILDIHALEKALAKTYGSAVDPEVRLQLMTIHNAKGLEFDHVLLPCLERMPRANSKQLMLWHEHLDSNNRSRPLLGLLPEKGQPDDPLYDYLRFEQEQRNALEATRLLYIAVTRAIRSAWLFGAVTSGKDGLKTASSSLLYPILPALQAEPALLQVEIEIPELSAPAQAEVLPGRLESQLLRRLPASWQPAAPLAALWPALGTAVDDEPLYENLLARTLGELVHLGLKLAVERGRPWLDKLAPPPAWRRTLAPLCPDPGALEAALAAVCQQVQHCLDEPALAWLFGGQLQQDACELALVDYSRGFRRDFIIDRTFIDEQGYRWIIDYKSSTPAVGQSRQDFLYEQELRYRSQLHEYAALFREQPEPLRLALFFTALPLLHPLDLIAPD
jgi:ATP-dependent helicase/nuclease subunit A